MNRTIKKTQSRSRPSVAFQGEHGAFSEEASLQFFRGNLTPIPCRAFEDVFSSVRSRKTRYGIIPIENSLGGSILQNYDLLERNTLVIIGEIKLRVRHALIANKGTTIRSLRSILSHPQALAQCDVFLKSLKNVEAVAVYDTAGAVKLLQEHQRNDCAAIANPRTASLYGLHILKEGIESDHRNYTRFLIISRQQRGLQDGTKTSIVFSLKDMPGALFKALSVFALRDINLHKIESRPIIGKPWEYLFYIDFEGNMNTIQSQNALRHLKEITHYLKVLGCYPEGLTIDGGNR